MRTPGEMKIRARRNSERVSLRVRMRSMVKIMTVAASMVSILTITVGTIDTYGGCLRQSR